MRLLHDQTEEVALPDARSLSAGAQMRVVAIVAAVIVALAFAVMGAHALLTRQPAPPPPLPAGALKLTPEQMKMLTIAPARYGANAELVRASGSISADAEHSTPILLPFSGQVTDVMVKAGERVTRGQPLFRIASPDIVDARNALAAALAQEQTAAQALELATANNTRQEAIYETAGGAFKDYAQARNDLVAAQATLRAAQSAVGAARGRLAIFDSGSDAPATARGGVPVTVYRAPVSGLVADRGVAPGQFISGGGSTPLLTITDPSRVWLVAQLAESDAANVKVGDTVEVTTPALPGRAFSATIDNIGAALDPVSRRLAVRATIANPDGALKPQMFAAFTIRRRLGGPNGVLVPAGAVIHEGDTARIWVLAHDGLLYGREVTTGGTEGGFTQVTRGLNPGDRVVTAGALFVNEAGQEQ